MRKAVPFCLVISALLVCGAGAAAQRRRGVAPRPAAVCGDPTVRCPTSVEFRPYQLPFRLPANAVIWETEKFYAVILKSVRDQSKDFDCNVFVPEAEREAAQALFPRNKVFASRCFDAGDLFYTGMAQDSQFMAVYAGHTRAEGLAMLEKVKATGRYTGANLRRMSSGFNGT
ncbi:MAG: hypothetical protein ACJ74T_15380 [Pyrinomonadaceae bacterium]